MSLPDRRQRRFLGPIPGAEIAAERRLGFLPADLLSLAYLAVTTVVVLRGYGRLESWSTWLSVHLALIVVVVSLRWVPREGLPFLQLVRETYPLWLMPIGYRAVGVLNQVAGTGYYDDVVLGWDRALFGGHPHTFLMRLFPWRWLHEYLHFTYIFYQLLVPTLGFTLFFQRRYEALRVMATTVVLTMYTCYLAFIFFPVLGPYYTFARPEGSGAGLFAGLVEQMLRAGASLGAAFPSSHVAGAMAVAVVALRFSRRLSYGLIVLAFSIMLATVYGSFHYAVDALAGFVYGVTTALLGPWLHARLLRRTRLPLVPFRFPHLRFRWRGRLRGEVVRGGRRPRREAAGIEPPPDGQAG